MTERRCGTCWYLDGHSCQQGREPYGEADVCEKWRWDGETRMVATTPAKRIKVDQRSFIEAYGVS